MYESSMHSKLFYISPSLWRKVPQHIRMHVMTVALVLRARCPNSQSWSDRNSVPFIHSFINTRISIFHLVFLIQANETISTVRTTALAAESSN